MKCCDVEELWDELRETVALPNCPASAHLRACPSCRETYRLNAQLVDRLSCLPAAEPPAGLRGRVMVHLRVTCTPFRQTDSLARIDSPIGPLFVAFNDHRLSFLAFDRGEDIATIVERIERRLRRGAVPAEAPPWVVEAVEHFFATWSIDIDLLDVSPLSDFELAALRTAARIPPGEVRSYGWIAREIGRPLAARAVGQAMARNPLALFFPCHRVVDSSGALHQYLYGLELKARILAMEGYRCG